jgi:hypothetical protein
MERTKARHSSRRGSVAQDSPVVALGEKLLDLAKAQREALDRGASAQFDALVERRDAVTADLQRLGREGAALSDGQREYVGRLQRELEANDAAMLDMVSKRMDSVQHASKAVRRFHRAVSPYLVAGPRTPSYVDRTN